MRFKTSSKRFQAGIIIASTFHLKQHRTPENALSVENRAIHAVSFRNALQSMPETACSTSRNAGTDRAETISRRGSRADCITLSDRPRWNNSALCSPAPTDTDRNRSRPPNRADRISPERSRQTGAACHGQTAPDFLLLSGQGSVQPVHCSPIAMQGSAFCGFSALDFSNCTKCLFVEIHKTTKTAYLLAFCKYAAFQNNFCRQFLTDYCDLYGL